MARSLVKGFDYAAGKPVEMTPKEWRAKYPPGNYLRATTGAKGETWYRWKQSNGHGGELVAEAYGVIPPGVPNGR